MINNKSANDKLKEIIKKYLLPDTQENKHFNFLIKAAILEAHVLGIEITMKAYSK